MTEYSSILAPPSPTSPTGLNNRTHKKNRLSGVKSHYDIIVVGSGLAALTSANRLARCGYSVLLLEAHFNYGGMATWFKRKGGHIFDISLHGFPFGMKKTCRKYWTKEIADSIVQLKSIRFDNPQFSLETTYDKESFIEILVDKFGIERSVVVDFFTTVRAMNFYDDQHLTTRELFERFFPGRSDVHRLLMEPIAYANGSTLDDPAITYGIVFSNFMSKGVFTFQGGTNTLIRAMSKELERNGVELRNYANVERILVKKNSLGQSQVEGVIVNGKKITASSVISNANLKNTIFQLVGEEEWSEDFVSKAKDVRMNNSSSQVYLGLRKGEKIPFCGELFFTSSHPVFDSEALCALECTSRTFSFYYPDIRPGTDMYSVVASINSNFHDWKDMSDEEYLFQKEKMAREAIDALERYIPDVRAKIEHVEVSTPRTFKYFTQHLGGASFGTKFEGLQISKEVPSEINGLFHAGSVGIIMSGWLGAANYGVIVSNDVDRYLVQSKEKAHAEL